MNTHVAAFPAAPSNSNLISTSPSDEELEAIVAAARPKPVPAVYQDRVVSIIGADPRSWHSAQYRKKYRLKVGAGGTRDEDWMEETDLRTSAHSLQETYFEDLETFREQLDALSRSPWLSALLGRLKPVKRCEFDGAAWLVDRRTQEFYEDLPSRLLPIDIDHLECEPIEAGEHIDDFITQHLPELEGCGYVWSHTGSSGIKGARVRLWLMLAEPRHLAACAAWAREVNARAGRQVTDASIYQAPRLLFTADPELLDADGTKLPRPVPGGAWHVRGDLVPADAFADVLPQEVVSGAVAHAPPREKLTKMAAAELLQGLGPENYSTPIHRWLCHVAWSTPEHRADAEFEAAYATIVERIRETSEPERLEERLRRHASHRALRRKWDAALQRRHARLEADARQLASTPVIETLLPSLGTIKIDTTGAGSLEDLTREEIADLGREDAYEPAAPLSVADARAQLLAVVRHVADQVLLKRVKGHWLLRYAPGLGKSTALAALTCPGILSSNLIRIYVPNHRLGEQLVVDLQKAARDQRADPRLYGDLLSKIRHHKGRSQPGMCIDVESKPKADRVEKLGISPKKSICPDCRTGQAGLCPWLKQDDDNECGIIVEVHASAVSIRRERRADLSIIDESIVSSLIEAGAEAVDLADLAMTGTIRKAPNQLGSLGAPMDGPTRKLSRYRADLVAALRKAVPAAVNEPGKLPMALLADFATAVTFKAREGFSYIERDGTALDEAFELETRLQQSLVIQIMLAEDAGKDAKSLRVQLAASRHAEKLYDAIAASMKCEREYVFGVAIFAERTGGKRREVVKFATRAADVQNIFGDASITLDGTADESIWRAIVAPTGADQPGQVYDAKVAVAPGALHAVQYADKTGSRSSLQTRGDATDEEADNIMRRDTLANAPWARNALGPEQYDLDMAVANAAVAADTDRRETRKLRIDANLSLIQRFACYKAAEAADRAVEIDACRVAVLLVAQKAIGDLLRPMLPEGVAVEHFGKLRGINAYERVPVAIIVGRSRPANLDLELLAEALHSHNPAIKSVERYHVDPKAGRHWREEHPDPLVTALQSQITTAGVQQAVARVRLFDRSAASPVEVHVFGTCESGLPVDLVRRRAWVDAERSPVEIAAARGCVFSDMRLNQQAHPGLFPRGSKKGTGRADLEGKAKWRELHANIDRHAANSSLPVQDESALKPNREVGSADWHSLLALEGNLKMQAQLVLGDALDFTPDGADRLRGRRHRLVKLRVPGIGYASYAIVAASWTEANVAQLLGTPVDAWREQTAGEVQALAVRQIIGVPDTR